ncbi:MAG TPA: hypothetical protein VFR76_10280, partial [Verrucomicrobiae bacterium]|nr:hypothetical protein [Verrucomicrobiae bacterium]
HLDFDAVELAWGEPLTLGVVRKKIATGRPPAWLWCAHCETSTGTLNDLGGLKDLCAEHAVKLCLDCISSIGTMPVDLRGVYFASGASGKGLRSYPGVSMVFHNHDVPAAGDRIPRYLDLGYYAQQEGIPFTFSSNLLHALHAAVKRVDWKRRFADTAAISEWLRSRLIEIGFALIGHGAKTSPAVVTLALPPEMESAEIGRLMQEAGYLLSYNSEYLRRRNWIQICLMGEGTLEKVVPLVNALNRVCFRHRTATTNAGMETQTSVAPG